VSRDLALGFQGNEKEITALRARKTHRERTLREDWQVVDGNWRHTGEEESPRELRVVFSRIRGFGKALRSWRKGMGVEREKWDGVGESRRGRSVPGSTPDPSHGTKMLGKMLLTKKAHEKSLTSKSKV
jgi:hypothetical protein